ncbi:MAG: hypothetical protein Q4B94_00250 [Pseudomonadota bacterium]|nr:hypothetical protein [Pseudomonadota bacterium]
MSDLQSALKALNSLGPSLPPPAIRTQAETVAERKRQREEKAAQPKATVWDGIGAANVKGGVGALHRAFTEWGIEADADFRLTEEDSKRWDDLGILPQQRELFYRATSKEHLRFLEQVAFENQQADQTLSQFGLMGNLALGLTDPVMMALDIATGGLGYAARAGRLANLTRAGLQAAGTSVAVEGLSAHYDPSKTLTEMAFTAGSSFLFAGALGARKGHELIQVDKSVDPDRVAAHLNDEVPLSENNGDLSAARVKGIPDDPMPGVPELRSETPLEAQWSQAAAQDAHKEVAMRNVRFDYSATFNRAKSPEMRKVGMTFYRDGVGYKDHSDVKESTVEFSRRHRSRLLAPVNIALGKQWQAYRQEHGIFRFNFKAARAFEDEVGRAVRGDVDVSPQAQAVAQTVKEALEEARKLAVNSGLKEFDFEHTLPNYLPRIFSANGYRRLFSELGLEHADVVRNLLMPAFRKAWGDEADDDVLHAVAEAWLKRAHQNTTGEGGLSFRSMSTEDVEEMRQLLKDGGADEAKIEGFLSRFKSQAEESSKHARAKRRIDMDENFAADLRDKHGNLVRVRVSDLLENNISTVMERHISDIAGWSAMSRVANVRNAAEFERWKNQAKVAESKHSADASKFERGIEIGFNATFNRNTEKEPQAFRSRLLRLLRATNFARLMNQVGFTQFAEFGTVIAHVGVLNFLRAVAHTSPMGYFLRDETGKLSDEIARILEELFSPGTDHILHNPFTRSEGDGGISPTFGDNAFGRAVDNTVDKAAQMTSWMSGMAPINSYLQKVGGHAMLLKMMQQAKKPNISRSYVQRLRSWGLSEAQQEKVFALLKNVNKVQDINPNALDFDTREALSAFMYRATRHMMTEADPADSFALMHNEFGKVLMQFRTFAVSSYTRHVLGGVHHWRDWHTYMMLTMSASFAGLGWAAREYLNTIGDPEKRAQQLTAERIAKNAIAQSSFASFLPAIVDTVADDVLGHDPVFANSRSTGLNNNFFTGNPTIDLANKAQSSLGIIGTILDKDKELDQKQVRTFWRMMFFQNLTGARNIAEYAIKHNFPTDGKNPAPDYAWQDDEDGSHDPAGVLKDDNSFNAFLKALHSPVDEEPDDDYIPSQDDLPPFP